MPRRPWARGFFRTELLTEQSTNYAEPSVLDYEQVRRFIELRLRSQ
jgi:hypothetical protein